MTTTSTPQIDIASIAWMPSRSTTSASPLTRSGKKGRPPIDNDVLTELRCRFPTIVDTHLVAGAKKAHTEIGHEMRRRFRAHHCTLLGVADDRLILSNASDASNPSTYISGGRPDLLLTYLDGAKVGVRAASRTNTTRCACGKPLHLTSRNYCKTCKAKRNRDASKARKTPAAIVNNRAAHTTARPRTEPNSESRRHAQRLLDPLSQPDTRPLAIPVITTIVGIIGNGDRQILIIDDRHDDRTERRLSDTDLIGLAREASEMGFAATAARITFQPTASTTDVALAVDTPAGIVIWVGRANAANPLTNPATHALPRLGVKIRELLDPTTKARVSANLKADLITAATKLFNHDAATIADAYELYERAKRHTPRSFTSILKLIGVHVPRTDEAWDFANKLHEATPDLPHAHAIDSAVMLIGDED